MTNARSPMQIRADLRDVFTVFDRDGDGFITGK